MIYTWSNYTATANNVQMEIPQFRNNKQKSSLKWKFCVQSHLGFFPCNTNLQHACTVALVKIKAEYATSPQFPSSTKYPCWSIPAAINELPQLLCTLSSSSLNHVSWLHKYCTKVFWGVHSLFVLQAWMIQQHDWTIPLSWSILVLVFDVLFCQA